MSIEIPVNVLEGDPPLLIIIKNIKVISTSVLPRDPLTSHLISQPPCILPHLSSLPPPPPTPSFFV